MICTFSASPRKRAGGGMGSSESDDMSSVFSDEAGCSSSALACSSANTSASSSRESSFDEFRSDSCSSDYCDDECESDSKLSGEHPPIANRLELEASQQALSVHHDNQYDLLVKALQCRWLLLRDQLQLESEAARESMFENAYLMLDPDLQPISPATDIPESVQIFEEHKALAKEYLQVQMEIQDLMQTKQDLEKQKANGPRMSNQDMMKEWRVLQNENEGLVQFHKQLKRQLELIKGKGRNPQHQPSSPDAEAEPGWVMVPCQPRRDT